MVCNVGMLGWKGRKLDNAVNSRKILRYSKEIYCKEGCEGQSLRKDEIN